MILFSEDYLHQGISRISRVFLTQKYKRSLREFNMMYSYNRIEITQVVTGSLTSSPIVAAKVSL